MTDTHILTVQRTQVLGGFLYQATCSCGRYASGKKAFLVNVENAGSAHVKNWTGHMPRNIRHAGF